MVCYMKSKNLKDNLMRNQQIDEILHNMAMLYQNLGTDSTEQEKDEAKQNELLLIGRIAEIDSEYASRLYHD